MIWIIIFLIACLAMLLFMNHLLNEENHELEDVVATLQKNSQVEAYYELEKGMDEQQESFEQEYLSWSEKEQEYQATIEVKQLIIDEQDEKLELLEERLGLYRQSPEPKITIVVDTEKMSKELRDIEEKMRNG